MTVFTTVCAVRLSARDTFAEAEVEAQWNWDQYGLLSVIQVDGRLIAAPVSRSATPSNPRWVLFNPPPNP